MHRAKERKCRYKREFWFNRSTQSYFRQELFEVLNNKLSEDGLPHSELSFFQRKTGERMWVQFDSKNQVGERDEEKAESFAFRHR